MKEKRDGTGRGYSLWKLDPTLAEVSERLSTALLAPHQEFSRL